MHRIYCLSSCKKGDFIEIRDPGIIRHLRALRLKDAEELIVFDEQGNEYRAAFTGLSKTRGVFAVKSHSPAPAAKEPFLTVACAIPKKSRIDDIIDRLTQIGADRIIPMVTSRVIVRMDKADAARRHARWEAIARSAAVQSQRSRIPAVEGARDFDDVIAQSAADLKIIATLSSDRKPLKEVLRSRSPSSVIALIGPEGDFSDQETARAVQSGFIPVSFGSTVLRVETAAVYAASVIIHEYL